MDWKQASCIMPEWLDDRDVWCIGAGALGSRYFRRLVEARVPRIHVVDDDVIEPHNVNNVPEYAAYVGIRKTDALADLARVYKENRGWPQDSPPHVTLHHERATSRSEFSGFVLFGLDSLRTRSDLFFGCIRKNKAISFLGDGRMGATGGRAYGLDPNNVAHMSGFGHPQHLSLDTTENHGGCVQTPNASATADLVAAFVLWRMGRWLHLEQGCEDPYINYIGFETVPEPYFETECW